MRIGLFALVALFAVAAETSAQTPGEQREAASPPPARVSPFIEFTAQPHALKNDRGKAKFDYVVRTPTSRFSHMRQGSSNALLECIVPSVARDERFGSRP